MKGRPVKVIRQRTVVEDGKVYNDWKQPNRRNILARNAEDQKVRGRAGEGLRIPTLDMQVLKKRYPDALVHDDPKALRKFLNSSEGRQYRTTPRGKSRAFSFGGI